MTEESKATTMSTDDLRPGMLFKRTWNLHWKVCLGIDNGYYTYCIGVVYMNADGVVQRRPFSRKDYVVVMET